MTNRRSSSDVELDTAPLLGADLERGRSDSRKLRLQWCVASGHADASNLGRWPLMLAVAAVCFFAGLAFHPATRERIAGNLTYAENPYLDVAVRVRVLNGLLQERYPDAYASSPKTEV